MTRAIYCLDANIYVKALTDEDPPTESRLALQLVEDAVLLGDLVAPTWTWAEVGSVLRQKRRRGDLSQDSLETAWREFQLLPIRYHDSPALRQRAWELAAHYNLPTLFDAVYLACTETAPGEPEAVREFWTADRALLQQLGVDRPAYVRGLGGA